jgi:hypothetical protein
MSFLSQHKLIIIVAVIIVVLGVWYALSGGSPQTPTLTTTTPSGTASADQELVSTLLALRAVKLDGTILSDPSFVNLRDFSTQIIPEPVGRPNPFAPLSVSATSSSAGARASQLFTAPR